MDIPLSRPPSSKGKTPVRRPVVARRAGGAKGRRPPQKTRPKVNLTEDEKVAASRAMVAKPVEKKKSKKPLEKRFETGIAHVWVDKKIGRPRDCSYCSSFIWGSVAYSCRLCGLVIHRGCREQLGLDCEGVDRRQIVEAQSVWLSRKNVFTIFLPALNNFKLSFVNIEPDYRVSEVVELIRKDAFVLQKLHDTPHVLDNHGLFLVLTPATGRGMWLANDSTLESYHISPSDSVLYKSKNLKNLIKLALPSKNATTAMKYDETTTVKDAISLLQKKYSMDSVEHFGLYMASGGNCLDETIHFVEFGMTTIDTFVLREKDDEDLEEEKVVMKRRSTLDSTSKIIKISIPEKDTVKTLKVIDIMTVEDITAQSLKKANVQDCSLYGLYRRGTSAYLMPTRLVSELGLMGNEQFEIRVRGDDRPSVEPPKTARAIQSTGIMVGGQPLVETQEEKVTARPTRMRSTATYRPQLGPQATREPDAPESAESDPKTPSGFQPKLPSKRVPSFRGPVDGEAAPVKVLPVLPTALQQSSDNKEKPMLPPPRRSPTQADKSEDAPAKPLPRAPSKPMPPAPQAKSRPNGSTAPSKAVPKLPPPRKTGKKLSSGGMSPMSNEDETRAMVREDDSVSPKPEPEPEPGPASHMDVNKSDEVGVFTSHNVPQAKPKKPLPRKPQRAPPSKSKSKSKSASSSSSTTTSDNVFGDGGGFDALPKTQTLKRLK